MLLLFEPAVVGLKMTEGVSQQTDKVHFDHSPTFFASLASRQLFSMVLPTPGGPFDARGVRSFGNNMVPRPIA